MESKLINVLEHNHITVCTLYNSIIYPDIILALPLSNISDNLAHASGASMRSTKPDSFTIFLKSKLSVIAVYQSNWPIYCMPVSSV